MNNVILIEPKILLDVFCNKDILSDFVDVFERVKRDDYKYLINELPELNDLYNEVYKNFRKEEDYRLFSIALEKYSKTVDGVEYKKKADELDGKVLIESTNFQQIFSNCGMFDTKYKNLKYQLAPSDNLRYISNIMGYRKIEVLMLLEEDDIDIFSNAIRKVFDNLIIAEDISSSIKELNDGFDVRKKEICYHLYCIDKEIPQIISSGVKGYTEIGKLMSLECTPERSRSTKESDLMCTIEGRSINCELHTKMKITSSKAPDRIYFCPCLDDELGDLYKGRIYIFKITKHV